MKSVPLEANAGKQHPANHDGQGNKQDLDAGEYPHRRYLTKGLKNEANDSVRRQCTRFFTDWECRYAL